MSVITDVGFKVSRGAKIGVIESGATQKSFFFFLKRTYCSHSCRPWDHQGPSRRKDSMGSWKHSSSVAWSINLGKGDEVGETVMMCSLVYVGGGIMVQG